MSHVLHGASFQTEFLWKSRGSSRRAATPETLETSTRSLLHHSTWDRCDVTVRSPRDTPNLQELSEERNGAHTRLTGLQTIPGGKTHVEQPQKEPHFIWKQSSDTLRGCIVSAKVAFVCFFQLCRNSVEKMRINSN